MKLRKATLKDRLKKLQYWKNQTSKTQKSHGGIQFINKKRDTQVSVGRFDFAPKPKNYQIIISGVNEARKGYPNSKFGITKKEAMERLNKYMKKHNKD